MQQYNEEHKTAQEKIEQIRQDQKKTQNKMVIILILSMIMLALFFPIGILMLFLLFMPTVEKLRKMEARVKEEVGVALIRDVMDELFDSYDYQPHQRIASSTLRSVSIPGLRPMDRIRGNDYTKGVYQGMNFEMSDIELLEVEQTEDENGHIVEEEKQLFSGLWLICDFSKTLDATITVSPRIRFSLQKGVAMESESFNREFVVRGNSEHDIYYVLTPILMERILALKKRLKCSLYFCFKDDGHVHILADWGNSLEVGSKDLDADELAAKFKRQLEELTGLIDELKLTDAYR